MEIALCYLVGLVVVVLSVIVMVIVMVLVKEVGKPKVIFQQTYTSREYDAQEEEEIPEPETGKPSPEKLAEIVKTTEELRQRIIDQLKKEHEPEPGPPPVAYCGHCGKPIFCEAVEALDVGTLAVLAHRCPACLKRTFLPQETGDQDG